MSLCVRAGLIAVAVLGAFAGGYFLKSSARLMTAAPESPSVAAIPSTTKGTVAHTTARGRWTMDTDRPYLAMPPSADPPELRPPPLPATPTSDDQVDPSDPAFQMIKNSLGIKTTLDPAGPTPAVLADAKAAPIGPTIQKDESPPMVGAAPRFDAPPARPSVKLVNNRSLALDFEVTKSGLSKVKTVELWVTRNGGATWHKMDEMAGCQSPFSARLGSDGAYGFTMVFVSESGMRSPEPRAGQPPELSMELDTTPPHLDIFPPRPVPDQPGKVVMSWSMTDANPDRSPTATRLEYSADGQTWESIALPAGRPNWGTYEWTLPPGVPPKVLFRLTARDKAGNVTTAVTNEKVSIDLVAPEGKITGVRSQEADPDRGPMPRVVEAIPDFWGMPSLGGLRFEY